MYGAVFVALDALEEEEERAIATVCLRPEALSQQPAGRGRGERRQRPADCDVMVGDPNVSVFHFRINIAKES